MTVCVLERRKGADPLMRPLAIVQVDPGFGGPQEISQGMRGTALSHRELELAHKALRIPIVGRGSRAAHGEHETSLHEQLTGLFSSLLLALVALPDAAWVLKSHGLDCVYTQISPQMILKSDAQDLTGAMP